MLAACVGGVTWPVAAQRLHLPSPGESVKQPHEVGTGGRKIVTIPLQPHVVGTGGRKNVPIPL